jgi:Mn2+/Fe2+ NRAMP family transporter
MKNNFWKALGPGIIWAGAAVGVSHLVQSTRAGAGYGFDLVLIVILINIVKYPFFEFGPRYAIASGENLIDGYKRLGKWAVWLFMLLTLGTMFTIQATVTSVTVGILSSVFPNVLSFQGWIILVFALCLFIVAIGKYKALDRVVKGIILVLSLSTVIAVIAASAGGFNPNPEFTVNFTWRAADIAFLIALAGWMPSAIDISVWHSVWTIEKVKSTGYTPKLRESLLDFKIGYFGTTILALCFLALGALCMYGTGTTFAVNGTEFSNQLFNLYTLSIGKWAYPLIALAATATMFSTTLTVMDAYPRVMNPVTKIVIPSLNRQHYDKIINYFWLTALIVISFLIMTAFAKEMRVLVDIATTLSFITAPVLGYLNYRAVTGDNIAPENRPGKLLKIMSVSGLIILSLFAIYFLAMYFI